MNPREIIKEAERRGIKLWIDNGSLRFRAPAGALSGDLKELLSENKLKIIKELEKIVQGVYPLSYNQKSLWFLHKLAPESSAYNVALAVRIVSEIDIDLMMLSFNKLFERHEMLRTTYSLIDGTPFIKIHPSIKLPFDQIDASSWNEDKLLDQVSMRYAQPFDLEKGPVARIHLFNHSASDHVLLITIHHIACDGWSFGILLDEFGKIYMGNGKIDFPPIQKQYTDYVSYQKDLLHSPKGHQLWTFWEKQLEGDLPDLNLPLDRARPSIQNYRGSTYHFSIDNHLYEKIKQFAKEQRTTLYPLLLAGFQVLLMRYSGQEEICVGTPMTNRTDYKSVVGDFINSVVMRGNLSGNPTFIEFLSRTRNTVLNALENQEYPFALLVEKLRPLRDSSRSQIFEVMFNHPNKQAIGKFADLLYKSPSVSIDESPVRLGDLKLRFFPLNQEEGQFDLHLDMIDTGQCLENVLKYRSDLFERDTIERMTENFVFLLEGIASNPHYKICDIPIVTKSEQDKLLIEWNDTVVDYPPEKCLHQLFEEQVDKTPDEVALSYEDKVVTYKELDQKTNQLAQHLRKKGIGPESLVGVFMERSIEMVIALYGILKAGGAYVPLDPEYPKERLAFMIEDTKISVILTQKHLVNDLPKHDTSFFCLDSDWAMISTYGCERLKNISNENNLAYVIFTSGSTGRPKGVMNDHRGICNRLFWMQDTYQLKKEDHVLQKTPYSFDVSVWEFFWPLLFGARLVIAPPGAHKDTTALVNLITNNKITTIHFVPSMLQLFLDDKEVEKCKSLRRVICSGEALGYDLKEKFFEKVNAELHNLYGPTEAAVDVTYWECKRKDSLNTVPIGRPVANTQIYILDTQMKLVPIGVPGELFIGGVQVARGYINRPELTKERFIPDPFSVTPGARLYKTGDLCRYLPDGAIEYLGRMDFQVKIRGLRIELGEIESILGQHPQVREAVVTALRDENGSDRLVGYFIPAMGETPKIESLRSFIEEKLPDYMVPEIFIMLDSFPLTSSGKTDRKALPKPDTRRPELEQTYVPPSNDIEKKLSDIWRQVLNLEKVGIHDKFFSLGGNSLRIIQTAAKIQEELSVEIPAVKMLQYPTISLLAKYIAGDKTEDNQSYLKAQERAKLRKASVSQRNRAKRE